MEEIFTEYEHYKVFPIIYSVREILKGYYTYPYDLCQLCFNSVSYNPHEGGWHHDDGMPEEDEFENINLTMVKLLNPEHKNISKIDYILCRKCVCLYSMYDVIELVQDILNNSFCYEGHKRFNEFIKLFADYVSNPYEKLLIEYFSYDMGTYKFYHEKCEHFLPCSNYDSDLLCLKVVDIVNHVSDIYAYDFLLNCPLKYMELLIQRGIDINHLDADGQNIFDRLIYGFINSGSHTERIKKLISLGANVNAGKPLRNITGTQYIDRPEKIARIKYLKDIGVNFSNKCISYCVNAETCKFHKMLSDTRLGKLIVEIFPEN